jgi:hypothetical protein
LSAGLLLARLPQCSAKLPTRLSSFSYLYLHPLSKQLFTRVVFYKAAYNTLLPLNQGAGAHLYNLPGTV